MKDCGMGGGHFHKPIDLTDVMIFCVWGVLCSIDFERVKPPPSPPPQKSVHEFKGSWDRKVNKINGPPTFLISPSRWGARVVGCGSCVTCLNNKHHNHIQEYVLGVIPCSSVRRTQGNHSNPCARGEGGWKAMGGYI